MPLCNESLISEALLIFIWKKNIDSKKKNYFNIVMSDMIEIFIYKKISIYNRFQIKFYK